MGLPYVAAPAYVLHEMVRVPGLTARYGGVDGAMWMRIRKVLHVCSAHMGISLLRRMLEEQDKHGLPQLPPLPATRPPTAADAADSTIAAGAAGAGFTAAAGGSSAAVGKSGAAAGLVTTAGDAPLGVTAALAAASDEEEDIAAVLASARLLTPSAAGETRQRNDIDATLLVRASGWLSLLPCLPTE